ncbi:MAG: hypothetical protein LBD16_05220 [Oscillospiraceae bacterium]|jgi:hypothetical protein|nr:hypothetical protein [Oscillospiraceae bacterium]
MRKWLAVLLCVSLMAVAMPSLASQNLMDLYLFPYNDMTDEEVAAKLNAAPLAPAGGALSDKLAGKAFDVITDQGATLSFVFDAEGSGVTATVALPAPVPAPAAEGAEPVVLPAPAPFTFKSEYAAKELNNFVLFALRQPDSSSAWAVAVDLKSGLAVAFELWFAASTGGWGGDVLPTGE